MRHDYIGRNRPHAPSPVRPFALSLLAPLLELLVLLELLELLELLAFRLYCTCRPVFFILRYESVFYSRSPIP
jgi:hypothetical protein